MAGRGGPAPDARRSRGARPVAAASSYGRPMPAVDPPPALVRPVDGAVRSAFAYDRAAPFVRGSRRTITLAAAGGAVVVAPCRGRVGFVGRTPGRPSTRMVAVRCGRWSVVVGRLRTTVVTTGVGVAAGRPVGSASGPVVTLSVRHAADAFGYVDPGPLLGRRSPRPGAPVVPAPDRRAPRPAAPRPAPAPGRPVPSPATPRPPVVAGRPRGGPVAGGERVPVDVAPGIAATPAPTATGRPGAPVIVWGGLAVAALGLPAGGGLLRRRRRRRARAASASTPGLVRRRVG